MLPLTDEQRADLTEIRALAVDSQGREIFVGLTFEESVFYVEHGRRRFAGEDTSRADRLRYLELAEKHDSAVVAAEIERRNENPPRH